MTVRFRQAIVAMIVAPMFGLSGCAESPVAVADAAPAGPFIKLSPEPPRTRRTNPCKAATPDLPPQRKEALFKQFTEQLANDPALQAAATTGPTPPIASCKQAAR